MKKIEPNNYIEIKKLASDWTDKKKYLIHYKMLKFYARHAMLVDDVYKIISFKQSKWFGKKYVIIQKN